MTKDLDRYKTKQKSIYKIAISEITKGKKETKWMEYITPLIHGLEIIEEPTYELKNIIEAREFLNNDILVTNLIELLKTLKKCKNITEILDQKDCEKLKSSMTLFNYITNPNFKSLLLFRGYEEKLINKVFIENKDFKIFKEILDKFFEGIEDNKTILLIESEMLAYSLKNHTLKNIDKSKMSLAIDILIKYSEFSPLVVSNLESSKVLKKSREFFRSLTEEEYELFSNFNIEKTILKYASRARHRIKHKVMVHIIPAVTLIGLISLIILKRPTTAYLVDNQVAFLPTKACMPAMSEIALVEEIAESKEEVIEEQVSEPEPVIEETPKEEYYEPVTYNYVEPTGVGNVDVVNIALSQVGNVGGYPYWSWYGFSSRVDWCSIFVSWVANQAGISESVIPKFARASVGAQWFIDNSLFRDRTYSPREGDLIFFDWDYNGISDHAGFVRYAENGMVYTVEGNTLNDDCSTHSYPMNSTYILGYGTPNY